MKPFSWLSYSICTFFRFPFLSRYKCYLYFWPREMCILLSIAKFDVIQVIHCDKNCRINLIACTYRAWVKKKKTKLKLIKKESSMHRKRIRNIKTKSGRNKLNETEKLVINNSQTKLITNGITESSRAMETWIEKVETQDEFIKITIYD